MTSVQTGSDQTCVKSADGTPWCWGANDGDRLGTARPDELLPTPIAALGPIAQIDMGQSHGCALKIDGSLWCWGDNHFGQLGDGTVESPTAPVRVDALGSNVVQIGVGALYTCARTGDGALWCWGYDSDGQLGNGETSQEPHATPLRVASFGTRVRDFAAGAAHACARLLDGRLWCWGTNRSGELGLGMLSDSEANPVPVTSLGANVEQVAAGTSNTCARKHDGTLWCWGSGDSGELGNDARIANLPSPVQVSALCDGVTSFDVGERHACAIKNDGALYCWGANDFGQVGLPLAEFRALRPANIDLFGSSVVEVRTGNLHTCARTVDGRLYCWGSNSRQQLGVSIESENIVVGEGTTLCPASGSD